MTSRKVLDPTRLDVAALAADGATLSGDWAAAQLSRWQEMQSPPSDVAGGAVHWRVRGEQRRAVGLAPQIWLHVSASSSAWAICQRCLQPFEQSIAVERSLRFVSDEAQAEALDAESEDDVLALQPAIDLRTLVEDELLLAWPIVPRHLSCTALAHDAGQAGAEHENPFAALAALKPGRPVN